VSTRTPAAVGAPSTASKRTTPSRASADRPASVPDQNRGAALEEALAAEGLPGGDHEGSLRAILAGRPWSTTG
jgi:hypothetical protein